MATAAPVTPKISSKSRKHDRRSEAPHLDEILALAQRNGLLKGPRTQMIRGRMPAELVARAKAITGISSDSKLIEAALANLALEDKYGEWLHANRGSIASDIDLMSLID